MYNQIGISTVMLLDKKTSLDQKIDFLRTSDIKVIELQYARYFDLAQPISEKNHDYLKSLDYLSIHAPYFNEKTDELIYDGGARCNTVMDFLSEIYNKLNAKAMVFHPNLILDWSVMKRIEGINVCIENMTRITDLQPIYYEEILKEHHKFHLILDTAHCFGFEGNLLETLIERFGKKIQHVHFSDRRYSHFEKKECSHLMFCRSEEKIKFEPVKRLDCPIIIEAKVGSREDMMDEIDAVTRYFR
jgi:endonuclease IV